MIVLIDSGNTRLKACLLEGPPHSAGQKMDVQFFDKLDTKALEEWLQRMPHPPAYALGTNVAGAASAAAIEAALAVHGCKMNWIRSQAVALGMKSRYTSPQQLGADRWVSMLGVYARMPVPRHAFLLACFGTATTLDTVSEDGSFEGGVILPGPALMRQSLAAGTANLPMAQGVPKDFPTDTHQAISTGVAAAQAGAVLRQWLAGAKLYGVPPALYAAGGGWPEVAAETQRLLAEAASAAELPTPAITLVQNPVLDGLASLALATQWETT